MTGGATCSATVVGALDEGVGAATGAAAADRSTAAAPWNTNDVRSASERNPNELRARLSNEEAADADTGLGVMDAAAPVAGAESACGVDATGADTGDVMTAETAAGARLTGEADAPRLRCAEGGARGAW